MTPDLLRNDKDEKKNRIPRTLGLNNNQCLNNNFPMNFKHERKTSMYTAKGKDEHHLNCLCTDIS